MRVALAQINPVVGDIDGNASMILEWAQRAAAAEADLVLFPEQAIAGYPAEDLLLKQHFLRACGEAIDELAATVPLPTLVGFPEFDSDVFNSCAVLAGGKVAAVYRKHHLPNYGVFDEHRYFRAGTTPLVLEFGEVGLGVTVCEDIWQPLGPASLEAAAGAHVILNLSASPYHAGKGQLRERMLATRASDNLACMVFCNLVGGQDELVFDGHSVVFDHRGTLIARAESFEESLLVCELDIDAVVAARLRDTRHRSVPAPQLGGDDAPAGVHIVTVEGARAPRIAHAHATEPVHAGGGGGGAGAAGDGGKEQPVTRAYSTAPGIVPLLDPDEQIYRALELGVRDYVRKNGFASVVVGLSGGVDSALTLALATDAVGAGNVLALTMPSMFSSEETRGDAHAQARALGVRIEEIAIAPIFEAFGNALAPHFGESPEVDVTEENLQARIRGMLLMAFSNRFGHLVLTTGNKSEMSVGYATLYGDMAGGFAPLQDVPKTLVYRLARWRNAVAEAAGEQPRVPVSVIERAPSAELRPDQKDEDSLPPYAILDKLLERYVEEDASDAELAEEGFDPEMVRRMTAMVDRAEYKRRQAPPGIKIRPRAFGRDRRLPITNRFED